MPKRKREKLQQFHTSPKNAIINVNKSINDPFGMLRRDYYGKRAVKARLSRKQPMPGGSRKLYDIYFE